MGPFAVFDFPIPAPIDSFDVPGILEPNFELVKPIGTNDHCKTKVRFLESPQYRLIPSREDYTKEEADATWYTEEEFLYIKAVNTATVRAMASYQRLNQEIYCARGLVSALL